MKETRYKNATRPKNKGSRYKKKLKRRIRIDCWNNIRGILDRVTGGNTTRNKKSKKLDTSKTKRDKKRLRNINNK